MASVRREVVVDSSPENTWDAVRDFGALDRRLVPGFVTAVQLDGTSRTVTFANGTQAREVLVDSDDKARRLVYAVVGSERLTAHSASVQVVPEGRGAKLVWISDFLPNELAPRSSPKDAARNSSGFQTSCRMSSRPTSRARWTRQSRR